MEVNPNFKLGSLVSFHPLFGYIFLSTNVNLGSARRMAFPLIHLALIFALGGARPEADTRASFSGDALFGWPWGTPRDVIARNQPLEHLSCDEPGVRRYRTGLSALGEANLRDCDFEFVQDRLAGVVITTHGKNNSHALLRELRRLYGPGQEEDPRGVGWLSTTTHARYDEDSAGDAYVYVYALRLHAAPATTAPDRSH